MKSQEPVDSFSTHPKHGAALIVTLLVLVLLVVIVTGFLSTTRVEQMASRNFTYQAQAQQMAMIGVQKALAQLNETMTNLETVDNFVSQPGRIIVERGTSTTASELYSSNSGTNFIYLNEGQIIHTNTDTNVYRMPSIEVTNVSGSVTHTNGRYAYWVDDEGTKANLNAMAGAPRSSFYPTNERSYNYTNIGTAGLLDFLSSITGVNSNKNWPYFFTSYQLGLLGGIGRPTAVQYGHSMAGGSGNYTNLLPHMTTANYSNTHVSLSTNTGFITNTSSPITEIDSIITSKINRLYFTNKFGKTFTQKYGQGALRQIVANINDWSLGATKTNGFTGYDVKDAEGIPNQVLGLRRSIYLNEIATSVYYATNASTIQGQLFVGIELVNPYDKPWGAGSEIILAMDSLMFSGTYSGPTNQTVSFTTAPLSGSPTYSINNANDIPARSFDTSRAFVVPVAYSVPATNQPFSNVTITSVIVNLKLVKLLQANGVPDTICDWANTNDLPAWTWTNDVTLGSETTLSGGVNSTNLPGYVGWSNAIGIAKNDPRVRTFPWNETFAAINKAWQRVDYKTSQNVTMGTNNSVVNFTNGTGVGSILNDQNPGANDVWNHPSFSMAFVAETTNVPYKTVMELGRVHTGLQWRTLWMRRTHPAEMNVGPPDWALLETFYLTNNLPKMNVNTVPFIRTNAAIVSVDTLQSNNMLRPNALIALLSGGNAANATAAGFNGLSGMTATEMTAVASNVVSAKIDQNTNALKVWLTKRNYDTNTNAYFAGLGEVLDIVNVSFFTNNDFINKSRPVSFLDSVSVASDTFMIYSVGQALALGDSQNPVAEYRCRALVKYDHDEKKFVIQMVEPMPLP